MNRALPDTQPPDKELPHCLHTSTSDCPQLSTLFLHDGHTRSFISACCAAVGATPPGTPSAPDPSPTTRRHRSTRRRTRRIRTLQLHVCAASRARDVRLARDVHEDFVGGLGDVACGGFEAVEEVGGGDDGGLAADAADGLLVRLLLPALLALGGVLRVLGGARLTRPRTSGNC